MTGRPRALARAMAARMPGPLVRAGALASAGSRSVSVVVVVTDDDPQALGGTLDSVARQSRRAAEVLLLATGPDAARAATARRHVLGKRARVVESKQPSLTTHGDAVATGVRLSRGRFLVVLEAGDRLRETALADLGDALDAAGADLAGGDERDLARVETADLLARRTTWQRAAVGGVEGPHARWLVAARVVLAAERPVRAALGRDLSRPTTGVSFGTMPVLAPWAPRWWGDVRLLLDELDGGTGRAHAARRLRRRLADVELPRQLGDAERCTDVEWAGLVDAAGRLLADLSTTEVAELHVESRVSAWLAAGGHREALSAYNSSRWLAEGQFATRVRDGQVFAELPVPEGLVPDEVLALGLVDTAPVVELRTLRWADDGRIALGVHAYIHGVPSDSERTTAEFALVAPDGARLPLAADMRRDPEVNVVAGERWTDHAWGAFTLTLDAAPLLERAEVADLWRLVVDLEVCGVRRRGRLTGIERQGGAVALAPHAESGLSLRPRPDDEGWALAVVRPSPAVPSRSAWSVTNVRLDDDELVVRGVVGPGEGTATVTLDGPAGTVEAAATLGGDDFECALALQHDPWGLGLRPLAVGTYHLRVRRDGRTTGRLSVSPELVDRTPYWQRAAHHRLRVHRGPEGGLLLTLAPPLSEQEVGAHAQQQLRHWYASDEHRVDPDAVYLQSYTGQAATDSPLAIHEALRRLRPDLRTFWAVADHATAVPDGARPVLVRSREWYAALASCRYLVTNVDMDPWFVKRPDQRLVQTFHGYPSKTMGIAAWQAKNFTPLRIARQLQRTSGTWDLLLTPTPEMDEHYRREYRYDGPILAAGYPRDDVLVGPDASRLREETRRRLGIGDDRRAVLYAPTWRDDLATNFRSADMGTLFDAGAVARALGADHVVLLRGHRFHRRRDAAGDGVVDVSDYPEVNDLLLAADAAVLDYSSMRFDLALLRRPMVFLVPDLDRYGTGVRGFLYDFRSSAPGPLVATTDEVVAELRDLDGLTARHAAELDRFNARFNARQDGRAAERVVRAFFGQPHGSSTAAPRAAV